MKENKTTTINPFKKEFFSKDNGLFGGVIENFENASTLKFWTKDFWKRDNLKEVGKGIGKTAVILGAMIIVGVLLGPIGWGAALIGSVAMGAITPKIVSACGSKGMEKSSEHRQKDRLNNLTVKKIQEKKEGLEKTGRKKKNFGIGAIVVSILITVLTGGAALPLLIGGLAIIIGGAALYSSSKDTKLAKSLEGINDKSTMEEIQQAGVKLGIVKEKDLKQEKVFEKNSQQQNENNQVQVQEKNQNQQVSQVAEKQIVRSQTTYDILQKSEHFKDGIAELKKEMGAKPDEKDLKNSEEKLKQQQVQIKI